MRNVWIAVVLAAGLAGQVPELRLQVRGEVPEPPQLRVVEFGVVPKPVYRQVLLGMPSVQRELRLTEAQKHDIAAEIRRQSQKLRGLPREEGDRQETSAARQAILGETTAALRKILEPGQRDRLDQIRLQAHGPLAFDPSLYPEAATDVTDLTEPLALIEEQVEQVRAIAREGFEAITASSSFPIVVDPKAGKPTAESVRALVASPGYRAAKQKAREEAKKAWAATIERIEQVLAEPQRDAYRARLGAPFDLSTLNPAVDGPTDDAALVGRLLNVRGAGSQQADPGFDAKVDRPAYGAAHPRVLFDEAHHNFHTAGGRYKPFADLLANDGYRVIPNKEPFTKDVLARVDVLVVANAMGAARMAEPGAGNPAFTGAECDAVRDWVRDGGSLLLVTDMPPFGSAAEDLAERFGVETSNGSTTDPANSEGDESNLVFTRENGLLGDHPILTGRDAAERVDRVQTFTGQSLKGPAGSVALLKLADTALDRGEGGVPVSAAGRAQGVAFAFGKGRVVVLGEAGGLSAQVNGANRLGMNVPGLDNRKLALNILHWLSGLL